MARRPCGSAWYSSGRPNTGKSSLFNALVGRTGAIVSDQPGTTRDYLTADLDLDGVKCQLIDTAGIETLWRLRDRAQVRGRALPLRHTSNCAWPMCGCCAWRSSSGAGAKSSRSRKQRARNMMTTAG